MLRRPIGLISGLGPLAGSDVLAKMLEHAAGQYRAVEDADYPDVVLLSHGIAEFDLTGRTSDRLEHELIEMVEDLDQHHPAVVGVACNTAHLYLDLLRRHTTAPIVNLIDEVARVASQSDARYLLLSSSTTHSTGLYHRALEHHGVTFTDVSDAEQSHVDEVVHLVMARELEVAAATLEDLLGAIDRPFSAILAGCTELPLAVDRSTIVRRFAVVDSNRVLAQVLVDRYYAQAPVGTFVTSSR